MKALIVDDEKHVRDAVRLLASWSSLGIDTVLEAENGLQAQALIEQERPEIIMTDMMMPLASGLDLLEWIHRHAAFSKTIVISGHNDFEFVRHTVKYGGTDYLLKPIDPAQLDAALRKAVESWKQEEAVRSQDRKRAMEMNQIKPIYRDKLLSSLVGDPSEFPAIREQLYQEFPRLRGAVRCRVAILTLDTMEQSVRERFAYRLDLLIFSLINICNELLQQQQCGTSFRYWNSESEVILLLWDRLPETESIIREISRSITRTLNTRLDFGIGLEQAFPRDLPASHKEARTALRQRNLLEPGSRIVTYNPDEAAGTNRLHLTDYEEPIRIAIRSGKPEQAEEALQRFIDAVEQLDRITVEQLTLWGHEYNVIRARWAQELFKDDKTELHLPSEGTPFIVPMSAQGTISVALWHKELSESMTRLINRLQQRQVHHGSVIYDIVKFIDLHYARDLTLQELSDQFFLSREYISRKFKQQFGENVVDYISRVRIDKAKLLLLNPLLKISDVAQSVGYQDEKYFSKVFKKLEGISPNEYRKTMKLLESVESN
ncbi:response regulator [Paenibacillus sp. HJGM_3]|uniref:response regulator n=1 Tax=Paenibacillus sp. HJGM_3 TaxID=3379816 RepID=UPI00385A8C5F